MSKYIQKIPLLFNATDLQYGELYQGLSLSFIKCWKEKWVPSRDAYLRSGIKRPEHAHWNWASKSFNVIMNQREDAVFEITVASDTQGVMLLSESTSVFCDDINNKNIHVDFLEVAPWNYFKDCKRGYFKGVGSALLLTAIQFSMEARHYPSLCWHRVRQQFPKGALTLSAEFQGGNFSAAMPVASLLMATKARSQASIFCKTEKRCPLPPYRAFVPDRRAGQNCHYDRARGASTAARAKREPARLFKVSI